MTEVLLRGGGGGGLHENFLKIDLIVVSEWSDVYQLLLVPWKNIFPS